MSSIEENTNATLRRYNKYFKKYSHCACAMSFFTHNRFIAHNNGRSKLFTAHLFVLYCFVGVFKLMSLYLLVTLFDFNFDLYDFVFVRKMERCECVSYCIFFFFLSHRHPIKILVPIILRSSVRELEQ